MANNFPVPVATWNILVRNGRIAFTSLLLTQGTFVTTNTNALFTAGHTILGSSNGVAAAIDGVNRCTTPAGWAVRGATTTTAQSWLLGKDSRNVQWLYSYTGASDDVIRVAFSPNSGYVIAGTATFCPTAADEQVVHNSSTIGATASGDRVWSLLGDSGNISQLWMCFRAGLPAGMLWKIGDYDASMLQSGSSVLGPQTYGVFASPTNIGPLSSWITAFGSGANGSVARLTDSTGNFSAQMGGGALIAVSAANDDGASYTLNGSAPFIRDLYIWAGLTKGFVGRHKDLWNIKDNQANGAMGPGNLHVLIHNAATAGIVTSGLLIPWDGGTAIQVN